MARDQRGPARGAVDDYRSGDVAPVGAHTGDAPSRALAAGTVAAGTQDVEHLGLLVHLHAHVISGAGVAPHHRVMAHDPARRVEERSQDRVPGTIGGVEAGGFLLDLIGADDTGVDSLGAC